MAKTDLWNKMLHLYEEIILYEAKAIVYFDENSTTRYLKDAVKLKGWRTSLEKILLVDQQCPLLIDVIDPDLYLMECSKSNSKATFL